MELERTFTHRYFRQRMTSRQVELSLALLRDQARLVPLIAEVHGVATHAEDDLVLASAVTADADYP
jgi:hypothetical protein